MFWRFEKIDKKNPLFSKEITAFPQINKGRLMDQKLAKGWKKIPKKWEKIIARISKWFKHFEGKKQNKKVKSKRCCQEGGQTEQERKNKISDQQHRNKVKIDDVIVRCMISSYS